ncbi:MAG TPA: dienelactone hydrolase family protein [Acidimicrobiales bacterium]|jgi:carboxymethylenebutenolidase|nr:dienelactone hydrolase family protein [Acidimicrobiales bacterium]
MRITLPSGTAAEIARPEGTPSRGLVLIPDIGSLRPLFDDMVARLAAENGWVVCAFDLWPGRDDLRSLEDRLAAAGDLDDDRVLGDAVAAADATGVEPVGVVGFCIGGMYAMKAAGTGRFHRAVAFYGMARIPEMWRSPTQGEPLDALARPEACPTLHIAGTADPWVPAEDLEALEAAGVEVVRYEGADHGFVHDPGRPAHRPEDAADAWRRAIAHLAG